ncbi:MAG: hypothetical protein J7K36_02320 [Archaeoglobaceae archaeon]|nr:hypothetical protein [Archaeoglobaceae archaeon]
MLTINDMVERKVIIDTGPLLLLAFFKFRNGSLLPKVNPGIPKPDLKNVVTILEKYISSMRSVYTTPYVISEFHAIAERRAKLKENEMIKFLGEFIEVLSKIEEVYIEKEEILKSKNTWKFCFTDSSILIAAMNYDIPILSFDRPLVGYCRKNKIKAIHPYYDLYLSGI